MLDFPRWKTISISLLLALGVLAGDTQPAARQRFAILSVFLPQAKINLGLDLQGGSHILLEGDPADVAAQRLQNMEETVRNAMRNAKPRIGIGDISREGGTLSFLVRDVSQVDAAREAILPLTTGAGLTGQRDWNIDVRDTSRIVLTPTEAGLTAGARSGDGNRDRSRAQAHRRAGHARADDHPPGRQPHRGAGAGPRRSRSAEGTARPDRRAGIQAGRSERQPRRHCRRPRAGGQRNHSLSHQSCRRHADRGPPPGRHPRRQADQRAGRASIRRPTSRSCRSPSIAMAARALHG